MSKQFRFTSRTKARKRAADVVFEADQRGMGHNPEVLRDLLRQRRVITAALTPLPAYSIEIIEGVANHLRDIDSLLRAHARVSGLDRIAAVDLAVMRVAVWEMLENSTDVPPIIAIDEAISIVKSISTDTSPNFVNAVLDAVRRDIESPAWSRRAASPASQSPKEVSGDEDEQGFASVADADTDDAWELSDGEAGESSDLSESLVDEKGADSMSETALQDGAGDPIDDGALAQTETVDEAAAEQLDDLAATPAADDARVVDEFADAHNIDPAAHRTDGLDDEGSYLTLEQLTAADLEELDELLDEY
ncbi:transcription antitermination factor NusB [Schaalia sp. ZJ405]|uniref:transcription antitermination factor NusB n=1 Tax=Schaalia sp. ZJ405 TaxID=2709403 RepID=UPI0013ED17E8|nr:transcription antitermination factor NusB [Schaalia sp. ZJ405]QPK82080.1 transcription antitermination factor NusB [Schaalia sp. ZJ405]